MDAIYDIAKTIANTEYDQLTPKAIEGAKYSILDTLSTTIAGSTAGAGCKELVELVREGGGKPESSILCYGGKVPVWMAAFANGGMSHTLDFDDTDGTTAMHPGVGTVPVGFAMAERIGKVNGKSLITSICLGADVVLRLGNAGKKGQGSFKWLVNQVYAYFGGTATCGKLLKLNEEQLVDAFGIVLMQASGTYEPVVATGGFIRGMWPAFTSKASAISAVMAQKGIGGSKESLEGKAALFQSFLDGKYDRHFLVDELGKKFYISDLGFKAWPCNGIAQPYIEATLDIVKENNVKPHDIDEIIVFVSDFAKLLVEPLEKRLNPKTTMDAKGSLPYIVAVAAIKNDVKIEDFTVNGINNAEVLRLAQKVKPIFDAQLAGGERGWTGISPGRVQIKTRDGKSFTRQVDVALGNSKNPMTKEQHVKKFKDCAVYSAKPLSSDDINSVTQMIDNLEELDDVSEIVKILS